jgi:nuclear pore complex protein Nup85
VFRGDHYRVMFASFDLFNILYLPDPDQVNASVGEPLMDWLNRNFVDPPSDEGDALSKLSRPWESDGFWPYIARAVLRGLAQAPRFFLETLSAHPQPEARTAATLLSALVADMPRLTRFTTLKAFESARDAWRGQVRLAREALVAIPEAARDDGFENWWNWASDIVGVLEGSEYILGDLCKQLGVDWKGVVAARALFAKKLPRRGQLP